MWFLCTGTLCSCFLFFLEVRENYRSQLHSTVREVILRMTAKARHLQETNLLQLEPNKIIGRYTFELQALLYPRTCEEKVSVLLKTHELLLG